MTDKVVVIPTTNITNPSLDLPVNTPISFDRYISVLVDMENGRGAVIGWASREELLDAKVVNNCYHIHHTDLHKLDAEEFKKNTTWVRTWTP